MLPCCLHGPSRSTKNPMTASKWHHRWDPRPEYLKTGWNISRWQTDKQQQNILCSATIWPWLTSAFSIMSLSLQAPPCVLAHLWGWLRKHDLRYASVTETPHPPACITDLMAPWGVVSFLCRNHFLSFFFFFIPACPRSNCPGKLPQVTTEQRHHLCWDYFIAWTAAMNKNVWESSVWLHKCNKIQPEWLKVEVRRVQSNLDAYFTRWGGGTMGKSCTVAEPKAAE